MAWSWWGVTQALRKAAFKSRARKPSIADQLKSIKLSQGWNLDDPKLYYFHGELLKGSVPTERQLHKSKTWGGKIRSPAVHISEMRSNVLRSL